MRNRLTVGPFLLATLIAGPASARQTAPAVHGPLRIQVAYPAPRTALDVGDSTFLFGSVGDGSATLTIAGARVAVAPNGAWLAWVAIPRDSAFLLKLVARVGRDSAVAELPLSRAGWVRERGAWVDSGSLLPRGAIWMPPGEALPLTVRAAPGATVRLVFPDGEVLRFAADSIASPPREGVRAFDHDDRNLIGVSHGDRYVATLLREINPTGAAWDATSAGIVTKLAILEVAVDGDTTRVPWPLSVTRSITSPMGVILGPAFAAGGVMSPAHLGGDPRTVIGRAAPTGTYTWFFASGTHARADMRLGDQVRLRLSRDAIAWVQLADVHRAPAVDDARRSVMGSLTLMPTNEGTQLRIPLTHPVPSTVDESENGLTISLFNTVTNANWTRYVADEHFVHLLTWKQDAEDRLTISLTFDRQLWGWRSRIDGTDLVFEFRQPPSIDPARPLAGRRLVIDPGHPPLGACGPTGLCEPEVNLAIAMLVRDQLAAAGAIVTMTRTGPGDLPLWPRVALADSLSAELLISIHNNALPDGVNPFTNGGTSTFFNHPLALGLARGVQRELVASLGLPDLGVARGDLALTRPTWYPAVLTEGVHLMFPEQEAALRLPSGQQRYAAGVVAGIVAYLRSVARGTGGR